MNSQTLRKRILAGEVLVGAHLHDAAPIFFEICGLSGFDYAVVDLEHSAVGIEEFASAIRAADAVDLPVLARIGRSDLVGASRYLDVGAVGLMFAQVDSVQVANELVSNSLYPPQGSRGMGATRNARLRRHGRGPSFGELSNDETVLIAQIESRQAIDELDQLLSVERIDGYVFGPTDLACSLGLGDQPDHPEVQQMIAASAAKLMSAHKAVGDIAPTPSHVAGLIESGYRLIDVSIIDMLAAECARMIDAKRTALGIQLQA